jgi:hypothetical protein
MSFKSFIAVRFSHKNNLCMYLTLNGSKLWKDERRRECNIKIHFMKLDYECADWVSLAKDSVNLL